MRRARLAAVLLALAGAAHAQPQDGPEGEQPQQPPPASTARAVPEKGAESYQDAGVGKASQAPSATAQDPAAPPAADVPPPPDLAALNPLAGLEKGSLAGFRDMPLFTPSRRRPEPPATIAAPPPPPPPPPPPRAPTPPPDLKLSGVVEGPDGAVAVVQKGRETERLRLGDQVDGWLVTSIDGSALKLTFDDREEQYRLFQRAEDASAATARGKATSSGDDASEYDEPD